MTWPQNAISFTAACGTWKASESPRSHHDQVAVDLLGNLEHNLLGVAFPDQQRRAVGLQAHALGGLAQESLGVGAVVFRLRFALFRNHVEQRGSGPFQARNVLQHADHLFNMTRP